MATVREYKIKSKQLPMTEECIKKINRIYEEFSISLESIKKAEEEMSDDFMIFTNPMGRLAEALYIDNKDWAISLAKHIKAFDEAYEVL